MATFDGNALFGRSVTVKTMDNPRDTQKTGFSGISGVDTLDQGRHGRYSEVVGILFGEDPPTLGAAIAYLRSYDDGNLYVFVDNFDVIWPYVKVESIEPTTIVKSDSRGYYQQFMTRLFHAY